MAKYFKTEEFVNSNTANRLGIDNTPSEEIMENLEHLMNFLDNIREAWGGPLIISSGYRCPELNRAVGGAKNSRHMLGLAADIVPKDRSKVVDLFNFLAYYMKRNNLIFGQLILEHSKTSTWVHLDIADGRSQILRLNV